MKEAAELDPDNEEFQERLDKIQKSRRHSQSPPPTNPAPSQNPNQGGCARKDKAA